MPRVCYFPTTVKLALEYHKSNTLLGLTTVGSVETAAKLAHDLGGEPLVAKLELPEEYGQGFPDTAKMDYLTQFGYNRIKTDGKDLKRQLRLRNMVRFSLVENHEIVTDISDKLTAFKRMEDLGQEAEDFDRQYLTMPKGNRDAFYMAVFLSEVDRNEMEGLAKKLSDSIQYVNKLMRSSGLTLPEYITMLEQEVNFSSFYANLKGAEYLWHKEKAASMALKESKLPHLEAARKADMMITILGENESSKQGLLDRIKSGKNDSVVLAIGPEELAEIKDGTLTTEMLAERAAVAQGQTTPRHTSDEMLQMLKQLDALASEAEGRPELGTGNALQLLAELEKLRRLLR